jgi:radical SAM superfamily enzyme YgiQ (UPF0313 family)
LSTSVFIFTPPFTQLNTPYPASAYLKGFLNTKNITSFQADLGIEVVLAIFCKEGLRAIFKRIEDSELPLSDNANRMLQLQAQYIKTIDGVIGFLQGKNPTLADSICQEGFLPRASRFDALPDFQWAFGAMGIQDKAKQIATFYLEDISDLIQECVDPHFGFSRYAERMGRSANVFDELYDALQNEPTYIDTICLGILEEKLKKLQPTLVAISVPFPGNLYSALRCGLWIKKNMPHVQVALGGGFANTELRSVSDERVFECVDFILLDDGESPLECLLEYIEGNRELNQLKRTFCLVNKQVMYINNSGCNDYKQQELGTPDYRDLLLDKYISVIEIVNPMHRLWSDGRWNKLTMAHGCYWGKCTFCDISLDYIKTYEPLTASLLCDRIEELIAQTGQTGFHFVDEAAPPALMRALAIEILKRKLVITWWTNIRFEKSFTRDLCLLLRASGCIAVSGGLEVASDRLLLLIEKGVTVDQVAKVTSYFTQAGIMVHAYLMYGFPTQTAQETIDSLEMVRQMFETGILKSAFWHQFAMTAHSPIGLHPEKYQVEKEQDTLGSFANNDIVHIDKKGAKHDTFSFGLKKSLFNYMHHTCLDKPLQHWFDFKTPLTSIPKDYILKVLNNEEMPVLKPSSKIIFIGTMPTVSFSVQSKKGMQRDMMSLLFFTAIENIKIQLPKENGEWLLSLLKNAHIDNANTITMQDAMLSYASAGLEDFDLFWYNKPMNGLYKVGLLV